MKLITAVVKPFKLAVVRSALERLDVRGMTVTETKGFGQQLGQTNVRRGAEGTTDFVEKAKLEIVTTDAMSNKVLAAVVNAAHEGNIGDGKVWVTNVEEVVRVRTGERNDEAI